MSGRRNLLNGKLSYPVGGIIERFPVSINQDRRHTMLRKIVASLLTPVVLVGMFSIFGTLAGCNTVEGVGKDISRAGGEIREEANEHRR